MLPITHDLEASLDSRGSTNLRDLKDSTRFPESRELLRFFLSKRGLRQTHALRAPLSLALFDVHGRTRRVVQIVRDQRPWIRERTPVR